MIENPSQIPTASSQSQIPCPLWRRLCAITYDSVLLFCVVFVLWIPMALLPHDQWPIYFSRSIRLAYLLLICFMYFAWPWIRSGQTLGMRSWNIKVIDTSSGNLITWRQARLRFIFCLISWSALGCGYLWSIFDRNKSCWHDSWSDTKLVIAPR